MQNHIAYKVPTVSTLFGTWRNGQVNIYFKQVNSEYTFRFAFLNNKRSHDGRSNNDTATHVLMCDSSVSDNLVHVTYDTHAKKPRYMFTSLHQNPLKFVPVL
jgi:hypothetical protein